MHKYPIKYNGRPKMIITGLILVLSIFLFQDCKQPEATPVPAESLSIQQGLQDEALAYDDYKDMGLMRLAKVDFDIILTIFSSLDRKSFYRASLVCHDWRKIAHSCGNMILNLSKEKLEVNDCQMLVEAPFSSLILRSCQLGNKEALVLSACARLKMLDLTKNAIDSVGTAYLAKGNLSALTSLDLSCNHIDSIGAGFLATGNLSKLTFLNIFGNKISDEGAKAIATGNLNLLTTLRIGKTNIGVDGVRAIANGNLSSLEWLGLEYNVLQDEAMVALATGNLTNLKYLDLSFNNLSLGDNAAEALSSGHFFLSLIHLVLKRNKIADIGVRSLLNATLPALSVLDVTQNHSIGFEGIRLLKTGKFYPQVKVFLTEKKDSRSFKQYTPKYLSDCMYRCSCDKPPSELASWYVNSWLSDACKKLTDFDAQDLAGSMRGLVAFKDDFDPEKFKEFLNKMFVVAKDKLYSFTPHNLSSFILDLGKLLGTYEKIPSNFLERLFKVLDDELKSFDQKHLATSLIGIGHLSISDSPYDSFLNKWQEQAEELLLDFNQEGLSSSLCGFAKLKVQPCKNFLERWEQEALIKLKDFNPEPLSITLYSLARLGIEPSKEFLEEWNNVAISKLDDFSFQAFSSSIYAYALFGYALKEEFINKIKSQYFDSFNLESVDIRAAREFYLALSYYGIEFPSGCKDIVNKFRQSKYNNPSISSFHNEVIEQLNRIFPAVVLESEFWIDDICCSVDIAIEYKRLIIEVDGPYHFILTSEGEYIKSPDDKLKDKLLTKLGWTVKRISYLEWPKGNEVRLNLLKKMLEDISI